MTWDHATSRLVEGIYDTAIDERGWMPLLKLMAQTFDTGITHLFMRNMVTNEVLEDSYYGEGDAVIQQDFQRLLPSDPIWPISIQSMGEIINDVDHYDDTFFESTAVYNEVMTQVDCRYRATTVLPISSELIAGLAITRPKSIGSFGKSQIERLEFLLPHITRTLRLQQRIRSLESDVQSIVAALDRLPTAAVVVSETLHITCVNRKADNLFSTCQSLRIRDKQLVPENSAEACALRRAVSDAILLADGHLDGPIAPPQVVTIRRSGKLPLDLLAVPLRPRYELRQRIGQRARALIMIYDPELRPNIDEVLIERLFGLTSTEAFVAARFAEGMSIAEVAKARRCSSATVRTHVKHIFQKTHTNRQAELVGLLLSSPAISFAE